MLANYQRFPFLFCYGSVFLGAFDEYGHVGSVVMIVTWPVLGGRNSINKNNNNKQVIHNKNALW